MLPPTTLFIDRWCRLLLALLVLSLLRALLLRLALSLLRALLALLLALLLRALLLRLALSLLRALLLRLALSLLRALLLRLALLLTLTALLSAEHLHHATKAIDQDFGGVTILAALVLPFAGLQLAFEVNGASFFQIFTGDLCDLAHEHHAMPFSAFFLLAGLLVSPALTGG